VGSSGVVYGARQRFFIEWLQGLYAAGRGSTPASEFLFFLIFFFLIFVSDFSLSVFVSVGYAKV
jgi:hypothetical protein